MLVWHLSAASLPRCRGYAALPGPIRAARMMFSRYTYRVKRLFLCTLASLSFGYPVASFAMQTLMLDFTEGKINADWTGQGDIIMQKSPEGVLLESKDGTGMVLTTLAPNFLPDSGSIRAASPVPSELFFTWVMTAGQNHSAFSLPLWLDSGEMQDNNFSLRGQHAWQRGEKKIGIVLPPHTTVMLAHIELTRTNVFERGLEAVRSFWTFDALRPYTINFVWGPQIGLNAAERSSLYDRLPPIYLSGTLIVMIVLLGIIATMILYGRLTGTSRTKVVQQISILFLCAWILFDLRMGSEYLTWMWQDHTQYVAAEPGQRQFRDRDAFYDFADFVTPFVRDRESYVFFAERPWPYLGNMRYLTYPSIPGIDYLNDDTWVIYRRPDMVVSGAGQMTINGEVVSPPGKVLGRFDDHSFVFRVSK